MDVAQKKQEILERIAESPATIVFARIDILNEIQLADLMKADFVPYLRGAANTSHSNTDSLHEVCTNLAKQRALLQGAAVGDILSFDIDDGSAATRAAGTALHNATGDLSYPQFEDSSYSNKTTFGYVVLHNLSEDGGQLTLSTTSNANTSITNEDGAAVSYFTDFSKYFLTAGRANGELISVDENTAPYTTPTAAEPFVPANTINGVTYSGIATVPTVNSDVRHDFFTVANTSGGNAGGDLDIAENKYEGNTSVTILLTNAAGSFSTNDTLTDFDGATATVKAYTNTASVVIEVAAVKGTFNEGETLTDTSTTADIFSSLVANTQVTLTLSGNTFNTAANNDLSLGFSVSNTFSLDSGPVRNGDTVIITFSSHGVTAGERIILKGADDAFGEFNDTFVVKEVTTNTITFSTTNSISVTPTGTFSLTKNIIFGQTSNASASVNIRTVNASANVVFQSSNLSAGFAIGNTITSTTGGSGTINNRTINGSWVQIKTSEVKTYYTTSTSGTWNYDASTNPLGIESTANVGIFWLDEYKPVKINQLVSSSGTGNSYVAPKVVLDIALATSSDTSGGWNDSITTNLPGTYFAYPLKTYEDQVHGTTTTLEQYSNFANVIVAPEGLDINYDWKPLGNSSGVATNSTHINTDGSVVTTAYNPEECTLLDKDEFNAHMGPYNDVATANSTYGYPNADDDIILSAIPSNRSSGKKVGTSGAVYPSVNNNPFFPAVSGTHKPIANTADGFTGTQPGGLGANDIYAGTYTQVDTGGVDPGTTDVPQNYRYIIKNDLKWIYASNSFDANSGGGSGQIFNTPQVSAYHTLFQGSLDGEIGAASSQSTDGTSGSTVVAIPVNAAVTCTSVAHANAGNVGQLYTVGVVGARSNMILKTSQTCVADEFTCTGGTSDGSEEDLSECNAVSGAWAATASSPDSSNIAEFPCLYNRVQAVMTSAGGALTAGATSGMETNFAIFYQLLLNLTSASYGKEYTDPVELTAAGSYTELGRSDASLKTAVDTMKARVDTVIGLHNTERSNVATRIGTSFSHPGAYKTAVDLMISYLGKFRSAVGNRILEISNRVGYLNGKNVASGGSNFISSVVDYLLLDSTDGTANAGDNVLCEDVFDNDLIQLESEVSASISVGSAGDGFAGYSFNSGAGYANTIYSHCNFLAGKKIKLYQKILSAIEDVDSLYTNIKSKRSEYYEYNQ